MASENFCIRSCILSTFQDSDVLLSRLAQNDAKFSYGAQVYTRPSGSVDEAKENYFRILEKWYLLTPSDFLNLLMLLISIVRDFARQDHISQLELFQYRGALLQKEDPVVHKFNEEFSKLFETDHFDNLDEIRAWISQNKDHKSRTTYKSGLARIFRDSESLKLLLRILAGISDSYFDHLKRDPDYTWPLTVNKYFDFRMLRTLQPMEQIHLDYSVVGTDAIDRLSRNEASIRKFREVLFLSGGDSTACLEFSRQIDAKKDNNPFVIDLDRELGEYFDKKPNRCPGTYETIKEDRLSNYKTTAIPEVNFQIIMAELRYVTPPTTPTKGGTRVIMDAPTPVKTRTQTFYKSADNPVIVETNTGLLLGIALVGGALLYASA